MKKIYLLITVSLISLCLRSQSYVGLYTDNYSGVHSVLHNPANIADSRFKVDFNLGGISAYLGNDFYPFKATDLISTSYKLESSLKRFPSDNNNFISNVDVMGPSILLNINKKTAVALFTRARFFKNITNINGNEFVTLQDGFDSNNEDGFFGTSEEGYYSKSAWGEIGLTLSNVLINKGKHFVKGGVSFKYLRGLGNAYGALNNVTAQYEEGEGVATTGNVTYGSTENFDNDLTNYETVSGASAIAFDLGLVYERRPDRLKKYGNSRGHNKYSLKVGVSLTDIGAITYEGIEDSYDIETTLSTEDFLSITQPNDIRNFYDVQLTSQYKKASLPSAMHIFADWKLGKKTYLNLNGDLSLRNNAAENKSKIARAFRATPRFETKWLSVMVPISVQQYSGVEVGGGLRFGPIYAGSGSFLTSLLRNETKAADAYLGVKIPIYQPKSSIDETAEEEEDSTKRDKDKEKEERERQKEIEKEEKRKEKEDKKDSKKKNKADSDNDGIPDDEDKCPDYYGPSSPDGCPSPDSNGDGIPDSDDNDGDGIPNDVDECPEIAGSKGDRGCPKVTSRVRRSINKNAKTILFSTGSTEIHPQAKIVLEDILEIIKANPQSQYIIEGHTDNTGGEILNDRLSYSRAHAVMNFLIENGIDRSRLSIRGYGAQKPINRNKTESEREKNRRVEVYMLKVK